MRIFSVGSSGVADLLSYVGGSESPVAVDDFIRLWYNCFFKPFINHESSNMPAGVSGIGDVHHSADCRTFRLRFIETRSASVLRHVHHPSGGNARILFGLAEFWRLRRCALLSVFPSIHTGKVFHSTLALRSRHHYSRRTCNCSLHTLRNTAGDSTNVVRQRLVSYGPIRGTARSDVLLFRRIVCLSFDDVLYAHEPIPNAATLSGISLLAPGTRDSGADFNRHCHSTVPYFSRFYGFCS